MRKAKAAFLCVHNSYRSRIAEAMGRYLCGSEFARYSAETGTKYRIDQNAVRQR